MTNVLEVEGKKLTFNRPSLAIANRCWPFVMNSMTRMNFGNFNIFSDVTPEMFENLQQAVCETTTIEVLDKSGVLVKKYLDLEDLEELNTAWPVILGHFLEHGFGLFSKFQAIQKLLLLGTPSDHVEEKPTRKSKKAKESISKESPLF